MGWDPALMRKYNNTGHYRLLNQLRSELKNHPTQRESRQNPVPVFKTQIGTKEFRPQTIQSSITERGSLSIDETQNSEPLKESAITSSFRERLNAIEMR
jgi:hypothetical protein